MLHSQTMKKAVYPVYQPIVNIVTGETSHYEALARATYGSSSVFRRVENQVVGNASSFSDGSALELPDKGGDHADNHTSLIRLGESLGFIHLVDIAIIEHVFDSLKDRPNEIVAVNVSGMTINHMCNEFLSVVFKNADIIPQIIFEITETSYIHNHGMLDRFLMSVRLLGGRIALDDFGAGFCTIHMVERVMPEFVKLDGCIVNAIHKSGDCRAVGELARLVHQYGGRIIAEHIDSQQKSDLMLGIGIYLLQGFYVGEMITSLPFTLAK